ncbi:hypothetical protein BDY24DRAFT_43707 [Mrakia frigida]|uniref:ESCO family N-acetyltransferase n=1 Tax=Mrakia frigida TaxID=29902 RepID=UPI003FCBFFBE
MSSSGAIKRGSKTYGGSSARKKARLTQSSSFEFPTPPDSDSLPPSSPPPSSAPSSSRNPPSSSLLATSSSSSSLSTVTPLPSSSPSRDTSASKSTKSPHHRLGSITNTTPSSPPPSKRSSSSSPPPPPSKPKAKLLPQPPVKGKTKPSQQPSLKSFFQSSFLPSNSSSPGSSSSARRTPSSTPSTLQQTHLLPLPPITTCQKCQMTYQPLSPSDETAHDKHHKGVVNGIEWGVADGAEGMRVVLEGISFGKGKSKGTARVVCVDGDVKEKGKLGLKISALHSLIDTHLSAPSLPPHILSQTKTFVLLSSSTSSSRTKESILGACVVQQITTALRVLARSEVSSRREEGEGLVLVEADATGTDNDGGVFCDPTPLPTSLGIHRIHTSTLHQRQGVATILLDAACKFGIYGMEVKKEVDGVAFSQPTQSGQALMNGWGKGLVRVFVEDP